MRDQLEKSVERAARKRSVDSAVAAERERCAKIIESASGYFFCQPDAWSGANAAKSLVNAIRNPKT